MGCGGQELECLNQYQFEMTAERKTVTMNEDVNRNLKEFILEVIATFMTI